MKHFSYSLILGYLLFFNACEEVPGLIEETETPSDTIEVFIPKVFNGDIALIQYEDFQTIKNFYIDSFNIINGNLLIAPSNELNIDSVVTYLNYFTRLVEIRGDCNLIGDSLL